MTRAPRRHSPLFALLLALVLLPAVGGNVRVSADDRAQTVELALRRGSAKDYPHLRLELSSKPPPGVGIPADVDGLLYGTIPVGTKRRLVFAGRFRDDDARLWLDGDFDGDLSDETPHDLIVQSAYIVGTFAFEVPGTEGAASLPGHIYLRRRRRAAGREIHYALLAHREGRIVLEGRLRSVGIYDLDGDLRFDDPERDLILLDVDGDGVVTPGSGSYERVRPGVPVRVGDRGWSISAPPADGARLVLTPVDLVPAPAAPAWRPLPKNRPGYRPKVPATTLEALVASYEEWKQGAEGRRKAHTHRNYLARIGSLGTEEAFAYLARVAKQEKDTEVRAGAVRAMSNVAYVAFARRVAKIAAVEEDTRVASAAIQALHGMDWPERAQAYVAVLKQATDVHLLTAAARYLRFTDDAAGRAHLLGEAMRPSHPNRQYSAYLALTRYEEEPPAKSLLLAAASSESVPLREQALWDAHRQRLPLARDLALQAAERAMVDVALRAPVVEILGMWGGEDAVRALLPLRGRLGQRDRGRMISLLGLTRDAEAIDALGHALAGRDRDDRLFAAEVLSAIPHPRTALALASQLRRERDPQVLLALVRAAGRTSDPALAPAVAALARKHRRRGEPGLRDAALQALASFGFEQPDVRAFFEKLTRSRAAEDRQKAYSLVAAARDPATAPLLLAGIEDKDALVRRVVVLAFLHVRAKQAVPRLVDRLKREEDARVREAIAEALYGLTSQNLYDVHEVWIRWWREHGADFEVPETVPPRPRLDAGASTAPTFYGVPVLAGRIVFVLDKSGSMGTPVPKPGPPSPETKFDRAVQETLGVTRRLRRDARVNVVCFDTSVHRWRTHPVPIRDSRKELAAYLAGLSPSGGTNLWGGLASALRMSGVEAIYLLSDGLPSSGEFQRPEDILSEVRALNRKKRISIHAVALGHDSPLLEAIAAQNLGSYTRR